MPTQLIITCEHGGNEVPEEFRHIFAGCEEVLATHRGYDIGALEVAERLAARFDAPHFASQITRLLVELNRSPHHRSLFSEYSKSLPPEQREDILRRFYHAYRDRVRNAVRDQIDGSGQVLHVSVHSFTATLNGTTRNADVGLLYDPTRQQETEWCRSLQTALRQRYPRYRVRRNYPYRGIADGFTTFLRKIWPAEQYLGVELELNQGLLIEPSAAVRLTEALIVTIGKITVGNPSKHKS